MDPLVPSGAGAGTRWRSLETLHPQLTAYNVNVAMRWSVIVVSVTALLVLVPHQIISHPLQRKNRLLRGTGIDAWAGGDQDIREALLELPSMARAVHLLAEEYQRRHIVAFVPDYEDFIRNLKAALDAHQLPHRAFEEVFSDTNLTVHPRCNGTWMEFGVNTGATITAAASWRSRYCPPGSAPIYGFDTFTGLPERWWGIYKSGSFDMQGHLPPVPPNVRLVKGLFNDSLPTFLRTEDAAAPGDRLENVTFIHIDCDLYTGAIDALTLLTDRIAPGAILLFDELINYPAYRHHELKALYEWLRESQLQLRVIGVFGPLEGRADAMEIYPAGDLGMYRQSPAFIVL